MLFCVQGVLTLSHHRIFLMEIYSDEISSNCAFFAIKHLINDAEQFGKKQQVGWVLDRNYPLYIYVGLNHHN